MSTFVAGKAIKVSFSGINEEIRKFEAAYTGTLANCCIPISDVGCQVGSDEATRKTTSCVSEGSNEYYSPSCNDNCQCVEGSAKKCPSGGRCKEGVGCVACKVEGQVCKDFNDPNGDKAENKFRCSDDYKAMIEVKCVNGACTLDDADEKSGKYCSGEPGNVKWESCKVDSGFICQDAPGDKGKHYPTVGVEGDGKFDYFECKSTGCVKANKPHECKGQKEVCTPNGPCTCEGAKLCTDGDASGKPCTDKNGEKLSECKNGKLVYYKCDSNYECKDGEKVSCKDTDELSQICTTENGFAECKETCKMEGRLCVSEDGTFPDISNYNEDRKKLDEYHCDNGKCKKDFFGSIGCKDGQAMKPNGECDDVCKDIGDTCMDIDLSTGSPKKVYEIGPGDQRRECKNGVCKEYGDPFMCRDCDNEWNCEDKPEKIYVDSNNKFKCNNEDVGGTCGSVEDSKIEGNVLSCTCSDSKIIACEAGEYCASKAEGCRQMELKIITHPFVDEILLDGSGPTPLSVKPITAGKHVLAIKYKGKTESKQIDISGDKPVYEEEFKFSSSFDGCAAGEKFDVGQGCVDNICDPNSKVADKSCKCGSDVLNKDEWCCDNKKSDKECGAKTVEGCTASVSAQKCTCTGTCDKTKCESACKAADSAKTFTGCTTAVPFSCNVEAAKTETCVAKTVSSTSCSCEGSCTPAGCDAACKVKDAAKTYYECTTTSCKVVSQSSCSGKQKGASCGNNMRCKAADAGPCITRCEYENPGWSCYNFPTAAEGTECKKDSNKCKSGCPGATDVTVCKSPSYNPGSQDKDIDDNENKCKIIVNADGNIKSSDPSGLKDGYEIDTSVTKEITITWKKIIEGLEYTAEEKYPVSCS